MPLIGGYIVGLCPWMLRRMSRDLNVAPACRPEQHRCQYSGRLVSRRIRRGAASYGTGGLTLLLDCLKKILEGHILDGDEDAHRVPPPAILNGEDIVLIISRPSGRRADRGRQVEKVRGFHQAPQFLLL